MLLYEISKSIKLPKKLAFLFPLSIFIMIFDRLKIYPTINISMYRALQIPILIIILIFLLGQKKLKFNLYNSTSILLFGFLLCVLISTLTAVYQESSLIEARRIIELSILSYIMFFFIKNKWDERNWVTLARIMMIAGTLSGLSVLMDLFRLTHFYLLYSEVTFSYMRPFGILGNSDYAAGKLGIFLPFAFYCIENYRQSKDYFRCYLSIICVFLIIIAMFFTGSRMGGAIAIFSIFAFMIKEIKRLLSLKIMMSIIVIFLIILLINLTFTIRVNFLESQISYMKNSYNTLFHFLLTGEEILGRHSLTNRIELLRAGINIFLQYPLFGVGPGNFKHIVGKYLSIPNVSIAYSHNTFITVLTELGIVGFLFYIFIYFKIISEIYYFYKKSSFSLFYFYLGISFVNLLITSFFLRNIADKYFWGMFIPISMILDCWNSNKKDL